MVVIFSKSFQRCMCVCVFGGWGWENRVIRIMGADKKVKSGNYFYVHNFYTHFNRFSKESTVVEYGYGKNGSSIYVCHKLDAFLAVVVYRLRWL